MYIDYIIEYRAIYFLTENFFEYIKWILKYFFYFFMFYIQFHLKTFFNNKIIEY